jgi:enterobacterial common antigen flippase
VEKEDRSSHKQILKSTGIIGAEQAVVVLSGIARSKIVAILLGPAGVGIMSIYQSTLDLVRNLTGFGLGFSAVRSVAEANARQEIGEVSKIILVLRRWIWFTGLVGMLIVLVFCRQISKYAFGNEDNAWKFALLSVTILITAISSGQLALLQGMRRIGQLAKANVLGSLLALGATIPLLLFFGYNGIVYSLGVIALAGLVFSWLFASRIATVPVHLGLRQTFSGGLEMARLGFFMVFTGIMSTATMYVVRIWISRRSGLDEVGQFQAAWAISSMYLATVLNGMGADYFPRLSAISKDDSRVNTLINEQAEVALLIAGPLIVGMLVLVRPLVYLVYSPKFDHAILILQWQVLGTFFRIAAWPIGFALLAKMKTGAFVCLEVFWNLLYLFIIIFGWRALGVEITGIAFLCAYFVGTSANYMVIKRSTGFSWSRRNVRLMLIYAGLSIAAFVISKFLGPVFIYGIGLLLLAATIWISHHYLKGLIDIKAIVKRIIQR